MTWANLGLRMISLAVLLPLALSLLPVEEVNLWLLFQSILALQAMVDFGFSPTFVRVISYARVGGLQSSNTESSVESLKSKEDALHRVIGTMRFVYRRLNATAFFLMVTVGTLAIIRPLEVMQNPLQGWLAWGIIVTSGAIGFWGGRFSTFLQGIDQIALLQRWQTLTAAISTVLAVGVLLLGGGLFMLILAMQLGTVLGAFIMRWLAIRDAPANAWSCKPAKDAAIIQEVGPAAWRSGLGVASTYGTIQGTGVIYAQIAAPAQAAAFLLALRLMQMLSQFANPPFYVRIPEMSRLYAEKKIDRLVEIATTGMIRVNWLLLSGILAVGWLSDYFLKMIDSNTPFVSPEVWWMLGLAMLLERTGAMHLQLYSTTNHIVWHIANGVTGVLMLCLIPVSYSLFGIIGMPLGIALAYAGFYIPFSLMRSYRTFQLNPLKIDFPASVLPITIVLTLLTFGVIE